MQPATIFTRFLAALGVPHTRPYSDGRFRAMTFKSLYGLSHLLAEYGAPCKGLLFEDKSEITKLTPPFLAQTKSGAFVIVESINQGQLDYDSAGALEHMALADFIKAWNGIALLAFPSADAREPDYGAHLLAECITVASRWILVLAAIFAFIWFFISSGLHKHVSTILLAAFDCAGLYFSYLLVQKTLNIHTKASESICGALEHGGCDAITQLKASKLFGVFAWSEVGFGYFGVSLLALLLFPDMIPALALCNICCLPYTAWSIWYQKFRAKHWCTLCVAVQSTLWALFFCYLGGGWLAKAWPPHPSLLALLLCYLCAVLSINFLLGFFSKLPCHEKHPAA